MTIQFLDGPDGTFYAAAVRRAVPEVPRSMPSSLFQPVTLLCVENTHNAAGGTAWPLDRLGEVTAAAAELGIATHMDGARLWNAAVATGETEADLASGFDTVSVCFSSWKAAVTVRSLPSSVSWQVESVQVRLVQPANSDPGSGTAVSVTVGALLV